MSLEVVNLKRKKPNEQFCLFCDNSTDLVKNPRPETLLHIKEAANRIKDSISEKFSKLYDPDCTKQEFSWPQDCLVTYISEEKIRRREIALYKEEEEVSASTSKANVEEFTPKSHYYVPSSEIYTFFCGNLTQIEFGNLDFGLVWTYEDSIVWTYVKVVELTKNRSEVIQQRNGVLVWNGLKDLDSYRKLIFSDDSISLTGRRPKIELSLTRLGIQWDLITEVRQRRIYRYFGVNHNTHFECLIHNLKVAAKMYIRQLINIVSHTIKATNGLLSNCYLQKPLLGYYNSSNRHYSMLQQNMHRQPSLVGSASIIKISNDINSRTLTKYSIRKGTRKSVKTVLYRFYRLHWGGWIRTIAGRHRRIWAKSYPRRMRVKQHVLCNSTQSTLLDKMVGNFWRKPKYYVDDPYEPYHTREEYRYTYKNPKPYFPPE
ncbi:hypothetical protein FQA39_LY04611 [Lamprigera yunnana]|nr:hypothetical protein FQA39_LY04611 [Lamprigera yunnana]